MWKLIYNLLLYTALPFFLVYAFTKSKIRRSLFERLFGTTEGTDLTGALWIHAASVGEAMIAENLITYVKKYGGIDRFLITTNTYYTRDLLRARVESDIAVYSLPFDLIFSLRRFMNDTTFKALLIVETELWPNLIWQAKRRGTPVFIVNGRISDATLARYRRFSFFLGRVLSSVNGIFAQSEVHRERFISIGMDANRVHNTGNLKYCREIADTGNTPGKDNCITFGSIKEKELAIIVPVIHRLKKNFPGFKIFVAPRELLLTPRLEAMLVPSFSTVRYSHTRNSGPAGSDIVIVDTVGDLPGIYARSAVAFVGGSLAPYGGQNMLEPLFFGTPVLFGPYVDNFRDIAETIVVEHAGIVVKNGEELYEGIAMLLQDISLREHMVQEGKKVILMQQQIIEKAVRIIMETIAGKPAKITVFKQRNLQRPSLI